jgi:hypothetical protein
VNFYGLIYHIQDTSDKELFIKYFISGKIKHKCDEKIKKITIKILISNDLRTCDIPARLILLNFSPNPATDAK